jgi:peptide-methionine (S)-S-oxide reductase
MTNSSRRAWFLVVGLFAVILAGIAAAGSGEAEQTQNTSGAQASSQTTQSSRTPVPDGARTAVFAGGCFWCMEEAFEPVPGVHDAVSGYAGGPEPNPVYEQVARGQTGHYEVVQVIYDPDQVSYEELLYVFWRNIDPMDAGGQFCDRGTAYLTAVFYQTDEERVLAEQSRQALEESGRLPRPIVTEIRPLNVIADDGHDGFWQAEDYHQNYYRVNPVRYRFYKESCGRARRLVQVWGGEAGGQDY